MAVATQRHRCHRRGSGLHAAVQYILACFAFHFPLSLANTSARQGSYLRSQPVLARMSRERLGLGRFHPNGPHLVVCRCEVVRREAQFKRSEPSGHPPISSGEVWGKPYLVKRGRNGSFDGPRDAIGLSRYLGTASIESSSLHLFQLTSLGNTSYLG